jgi:hypothetical protein
MRPSPRSLMPSPLRLPCPAASTITSTDRLPMRLLVPKPRRDQHSDCIVSSICHENAAIGSSGDGLRMIEQRLGPLVETAKESRENYERQGGREGVEGVCCFVTLPSTNPKSSDAGVAVDWLGPAIVSTTILLRTCEIRRMRWLPNGMSRAPPKQRDLRKCYEWHMVVGFKSR